MKKLLRWLFKQYNRKGVQTLVSDVKKNRAERSLYRNFDWLLLALILAISFFGVLAIFSATSSATEKEVTGLANILATHSTRYSILQLLWIGAGLIAMFAMTILDYHVFGKYSLVIYCFTLGVLFVVLFVQAGRGGMSAFFKVGSGNSSLGQRTMQPSEFSKVSLVICLAYMFSRRKTPIRNMRELFPTALYAGIPVFLIVLQPDVGTAIVALVIYLILLYIDGTKRKLIYGVILVAVALAIPAWYYINTASDNFRLTRILMWLNPEQYADEASQVLNGQIAIGSGGLTGKGVLSIGSFASLGYIPDDHTDFCFAIVCEAFGFIGAVALVLALSLVVARLIQHAYHTEDKFGEYIIIGTAAMFIFHILENICMILGILPVTGIPLSFISYGGSNYLSSMMNIGLVMNVVMRSRQKKLEGSRNVTKEL